MLNKDFEFFHHFADSLRTVILDGGTGIYTCCVFAFVMVEVFIKPCSPWLSSLLNDTPLHHVDMNCEIFCTYLSLPERQNINI